MMGYLCNSRDMLNIMKTFDDFQTGFVELETGVRLHYVDTGGDDKVPLIAVHGMLGTPKKDLQSVIEWLAQDYRVIAPTMRGYGQSSPELRTFSMDFYQQDAQDLLTFMDVLGIKKAHLLGYSDGGEIVLIVGGTQPEHVLSVASIGAVGYFGTGMRPSVQNMFPGHWITQEERQLHGITNVDAFVLGWINAVRHIIDSGGDLSLSLIPNLTAPLLVMLGETDRLNPSEYGQRLVDSAPNGQLATFKCGHGIHQESFEEFKAVYGRFLRQ